MIDMLIAAATVPLAALATVLPPPVVVSADSSPVPTSRQQLVVVLRPVGGSCADGELDISAIENPGIQLLWQTNKATGTPHRLNFRIDERGRALGIERDPAGFGLFPDLSPSLAASRFEKGKPRSGCSIDYSAESTSMADADVNQLIAYSIFREPRPPKELFDRLIPNGSDCYPQRPAVLLQAYPDFSKISASQGRIDWTMVKFEIDAAGMPVAIGIHATTGNKELDRASIAAITKSRYAKGPKKGCLYPYWLSPKPVPAPHGQKTDDIQASKGNCPAKVEWKTKPSISYPESFRRRAVEGWAIVTFDVAPWGVTGNVKVVAAEPAAEFGDTAANMVRNATVAVSEQGYSSCSETMRFVMSSDDPNPKTD